MRPRRVFILPPGACAFEGTAIVGGWNPANPDLSDSTVWLDGGCRGCVLGTFDHMHFLGANINLVRRAPAGSCLARGLPSPPARP